MLGGVIAVVSTFRSEGNSRCLLAGDGFHLLAGMVMDGDVYIAPL